MVHAQCWSPSRLMWRRSRLTRLITPNDLSLLSRLNFSAPVIAAKSDGARCPPLCPLTRACMQAGQRGRKFFVACGAPLTADTPSVVVGLRVLRDDDRSQPLLQRALASYIEIFILPLFFFDLAGVHRAPWGAHTRAPQIPRSACLPSVTRKNAVLLNAAKLRAKLARG